VLSVNQILSAELVNLNTREDEEWILIKWESMYMSWRQLIELRTKPRRTLRNRVHRRRSRRPRYLKL
jgi:hypothetical protein